MLPAISDYSTLKKKFSIKFEDILRTNPVFKRFVYEICTLGTAYVLGGFIRDIVLGKPSRDLDILIHLPNTLILNALQEAAIEYQINRLNGIKLSLSGIEVDLWSIDYNWAFVNKVVEVNDDNILESIAAGCFYNYDSLVINLHSNNLNARHYNELANTNTLDILKKNQLYKKLNPTIEANILRAFFLKDTYDLRYSHNCLTYLKSRIGYLEDQYGSAVNRLEAYVVKYPKYKNLAVANTLTRHIEYCNSTPVQQSLDFNT